MWYISTSSAQGTEEGREVDYAFKILLLNVALEKHISKLYVRHHSSKSKYGHVLYTYVALPAFSLHSLFLHAPFVNYALGEGGHGTT